MRTLFVYGTLRHPPLLAGLLGRAVQVRPATLSGHRAARLEGRPYPGLVTDPDGSAIGAVVDVDDGELRVLDHFEGAEYTRTAVAVSVEGKVVPAETYLLTGPSRALATGQTWSFDAFVEHEAHSWVQRADPWTRHPAD